MKNLKEKLSNSLSNVHSILLDVVKQFNASDIDNSLPDKEVLIGDAYSDLDKTALADKATKTFYSLNSSIAAALRLKKSIDNRISEFLRPHVAKLVTKVLGTDEYHVRLLPKDKQKRTIFDKITFSVVSVITFATPLIAWFAMSQYLTASGIFPDFYEYWWKPLLFSVLGVTSAFLLKQYEDRLLKDDESKRKFVKRITWASIITISLWILLFATLFSFAETGLLEDSIYEPLATWGFTVLQLFSEITAGTIVWSYASFLNNKNKEYETSESAVFKTAEELEDFYSADQFTLEAYSDSLASYVERFENMKEIYVANYLSQVTLIRGRISMKQTQATFQYIDSEIGDVKSLKVSSLKLI